MSLIPTGLFDLAEKRLAWTAQRQAVLASNIANANTPGFQARDVQSFASVLSGAAPAGLALTQPGHLSGTSSLADATVATPPPRGRSLDGNSVALDQQLTKVADTESTQALVSTIWKKYAGMLGIVLGRGG